MRHAFALLILLFSASAASAVAYNVDIDETQSELILTIGGGDYSGAMDGTFHFTADPDLGDGATAVISDLDAVVEDIDMGLAALRDITIVSNPAIPSWGDIDDPLFGDDHVNINQMLFMVLDAVYDPLFGGNEPVHSDVQLCLGDVDFCAEPNGLANLNTATLWFDVDAQGVIPAEESPTGTDIPFRVVIEGQGEPDGPTAVAESGFTGVTGELGIWPNPAGELVLFAMDRANAAPISVEIFDIAGRRVAQLTGQGSSLQWDRHGGDGRRVSAGVYLARYRQGEQSGCGKLLLLR